MVEDDGLLLPGGAGTGEGASRDACEEAWEEAGDTADSDADKVAGWDEGEGVAASPRLYPLASKRHKAAVMGATCRISSCHRRTTHNVEN